jgi:hypothetical protein
LGGVVEAEGTGDPAGDGFALAEAGADGVEMGGVGGKIGEAEAGKHAGGEEAEGTTAAWGDVSHEFQGESAHGEAGIDLDQGFESGLPPGIAVEEGVDANGSVVTGAAEVGFEALDPVEEERVDVLGEIGMGGERAEDGGGWASVEAWFGGIGEELTAGIIEEGGIADESKGGGFEFELEGEVGDAVEPGFDDECSTFCEAGLDPAFVLGEDGGFPEACHGVAGEAEVGLDDDGMMVGGADALDLVEGLIRGGDGDAGDFGRAEPG